MTEGCRRSRPLRGLKAQRRQPPCAGGGQPRCTERERRCTKRERMYRERGRRCTQVQVLYICIVCMYHVYVYRDFICLLNGTAAASPHWSRALRCRKMLRSLAGGGGGGGGGPAVTALPCPAPPRWRRPRRGGPRGGGGGGGGRRGRGAGGGGGGAPRCGIASYLFA